MIKGLPLGICDGIRSAEKALGFTRDEIIAVLIDVFKVVFHLVGDILISDPSRRIDNRFRNRERVAEVIGHLVSVLKPTEEGVATVCIGSDCHLGLVSILFTYSIGFSVG